MMKDEVVLKIQHPAENKEEFLKNYFINLQKLIK